MHAGAPAARTAVVVVSGVGDSPRDSATDAVVRALLTYCPDVFDRGEERVDWYQVPGQDPQPVKRSRLRTRDATREVDVFEMWWADLGRFPGAVRASLRALVGMLLIAPSIGRAALSGGPPLRRGAPAPSSSRDWGRCLPFSALLMGILEWIVAVPLLLLSALELVTVAAAAFAIWSGASTTATYAGVSGIGLLTIGGVTWFTLGYRATRFAAEWVGWALVGGFAGVGAWCVLADGGKADRGLADSLLLMSMYPLRVGWMVAATIAVVVCVVVGTSALRPAGAASLARGRTALASLVGPFGLAITGAILTAGLGAVLRTTASTAFSGKVAPWCLRGIQDWSPQSCTIDDATNAYVWAAHLFGQFLIPLVYVAASLLTVLLGTLVFVLLWRVLGLILRRAATRGPLDVTDLLPHISLGTAIAVLPCAVFVLASWVPLGLDTFVPYSTPVREWPSTLAAIAGLAVTAFTWIAGVLRWSPLDVLQNSPENGGFTAALDRVYDVASFLRQPHDRGRRVEVVPRFLMLGRFDALLAHIAQGGWDREPYGRLVVFAHSQGTVLATAALDRAPGVDVTPPGVDVREVALITFGSPLRNLYCASFPAQFSWVGELLDDPYMFVKGVRLAWDNYGADDDPVGRTIFGPAPVRDTEQPGDAVPGNWSNTGYPHGDRTIGPGGHGAYWSNPHVFRRLADLATT